MATTTSATPHFGIIGLLLAILVLLPPPAHPTENDYKLPLTVREPSDIYLSMMDLSGNAISGPCCQLRRGQRTYTLTGAHPIVTDDNEIIEVVSTNNQCTLRVRGATASSKGDWRIHNCQNAVRKFNVTVRTPPTAEDCLTGATADCRLINLETQEERGCGSNVTDWSSYKCVRRVAGLMPFAEKIYPEPPQQLRQRPSSGVWDDVEESETYQNFLLDCKAENVTVTSCTVEHVASRRTFNVRDGLQEGDYSAFKTELEDGFCQFEIPMDGDQPHQVRDKDLGKWRMVLNATEDGVEKSIKVCQFWLKPQGEENAESAEDREQLVRNEVNGTVINCAQNEIDKVDTCYARTPSGNIKRQLPGPGCEFLLDETGTWLCGYNVDGTEFINNVEQQIVVHPSAAINGQWDSATGVLRCEHIHKQPLNVCMFLSPENRPYSMPQGDQEEHTKGVCQMKTELPFEQGWRCIIQTMESPDHHETPVMIRTDGAVEDFSA